jgi:hypothetical protein
MDAAAPSVNTLQWVSGMIRFPNDSQKAVSAAYNMIEELLAGMMLLDFVVMAAPSPAADELHYDVAVKPLELAPFVAFKVIFRVQP